MKVFTPLIAWHNRDRVSAIDFQPVPHPRPTKDGGTRIATGGDDNHVIVSVSKIFGGVISGFFFLKFLV